jgi:CheY-like chemotaxis protein
MAKTILVIDDEDDVRLAVKMLLTHSGYSVVDANGGKAGLALLKKQKFDLVICDFFMPEMNGRQVIESIAKNPKLKGQKVVLLTVASFGKEGHEKLKKLKVSDYVQKPFENSDLLSRVAKLVGK